MSTRLLFTLLTSVLFLKLSAQTNFRFADSTAQWNTLNSANPYFVTYRDKIVGDTVISDLKYQAVSSNYHGMAFIRKDSAGRMFSRINSDTTDIFIYDFSKNAGDTLTGLFNWNGSTLLVVVDSTDSIYAGHWRKRLFVTYLADYILEDYNPVTWVEGIGALNGDWLNPTEFMSTFDGGISTLCFFENDQLVYHDDYFSTCDTTNITGLASLQDDHSIKIFPNPITDNQVQIHCEGHLPEGTMVQLFDVTGRMVLQKAISEQTTTLYLNGYSQGLYLYSIVSAQKIYSGKLAVQ